MEEPRPEKVAVVDEVRNRLDGAEAAILTEYRGLTVAELAQLRRALAAVGGDYKIYKNTLVRRAVSGGRHEPLTGLLTGPTAIAFVSGEVSAVAKALRDFSRTYPALVLKGGQHGDGVLSAAELVALADLPPRDVLLAQLAGVMAAPMRQLAGLLQAVPRDLAYGLKALLDKQGGAPAAAAEPPTAEPPTAEPAAADEPAAFEVTVVEADAGEAEPPVPEAPAAEATPADADAADAEPPAPDET